MPQINVGLLPDDGTGDTLRQAGLKINQYGQLNDKSVNAAFYKTAAISIEAALNLAIPAAAALGTGASVWIPNSMLPYNAALVTFNNAVVMAREGVGLDIYDIRAYGAAGNGITDDTAAIQAAISAARASASTQRAGVYGPSGTYIVSATLDFADVSFDGAGMFATTIKLAPNAGNGVNPIFRVDSGGQAHYQSFGIDGNQINNPGAFQSGIQIKGASVYCTWKDILILSCTQNGLQVSLSAGNRPAQHTFINLTIRSGLRIGVRLDAGYNLHFLQLDVELNGSQGTGFAAVALTGTDEACQRVVFDNLWIEKVGVATASADGVEIDAGTNIAFRKGTILDYGLTAGGGGNAINILGGSNIDIDGIIAVGRAASQANQRKIKIAAGVTDVKISHMALTTTGAAADLEDNSTTGARHLTTRSASPIITPSEAVLVSGVDVSAGDVVIPAALTAARLVGAPLNPVKGQRVLWTLIQDGTGGRVVTWNAIFKLIWSDTGNTLNKRSSIATVFDGTNWNQDGAQTPYV